MSDKLNALSGTVILLGDQIRDSLAAAMESDELTRIREPLKDADGRMQLVIQAAKATQPDAESGSD